MSNRRQPKAARAHEQEAISSPSSPSRLRSFGRDYGWIIQIIVTLVAIFVTVLVFSSHVVGKYATFQQRTQDFEKTTTTQLHRFGDEISAMATIICRGDKACVLAMRTAQAASDPTNKANIAQAKQALSDARQNSVRLPARIVKQFGESFIGAASKEPAAWDAALRFMGYRSFLNEGSAPTGKPSRAAAVWAGNLSLFSPLRGSIAQTAGEAVPRERAAVVELIGQHLNANKTMGPKFLLFDVHDVTATLDGYRLKNVIFRGATIRYNGGPLEMENVYFVNCTFELKHMPSSVKLGEAILSSVPTTFKTAG